MAFMPQFEPSDPSTPQIPMTSAPSPVALAPAPPAAPKKTLFPKKSPYAGMRAQAGTPVARPQMDMGLQQPAEPLADPRSAPAPAMPPLVARGPAPYPGWNSQQYGRESMATGEFGRTASRDRADNVYQDPGAYTQHQNEVLDSPIMKQLADSTNQIDDFRKNFIQNYKVQDDLSPLMALADYVAGDKGTARSGYRRPASFEETSANILNLLQQSNQAHRAGAQAALEQTGGLKSGQENAAVKQEAQQGEKEGFTIPHPPFMNPFTMAQAYGKDYQSNPTVKQANDEIASANQMMQLIKTPNWFTEQALRGSMVQSLNVNRITQNELQVFGGGSPDLWNRAQNAFSRLTTGETLSQSDLHTMEEFANARLRTALAKRDQAHQAMNAGLGGFLPPGMADRLNYAGDVQPLTQPTSPIDEARRAEQKHQELLQMMKDMK